MATYKPLQSIVLTSSTTSVVFSGIDQSYTDLIIVSSLLKPTGGSPRFRLNSDSSSLYSQTVLYGNGSSALSAKETDQTAYYLLDFFSPSTTNANLATLHLLNYSNTTTFKNILEKSGSAGVGTQVSIGVYRSTNAITSVTINADGSTGVFSAGSTFDLYGIKSGAPQALGGDLVTTDGNYWYHTFRSTQTFTPLRALSVDYLVVAGGGGAGGSGASGGGGAGGLRSTVTATGGGGTLESALSVTSGTAYTITVGAGGAAGASNTNGTNGTNSVFSTITSVGGGGGGRQSPYSGNAGGSGGGGYYTGTGGAGTANQGYAGGNGHSSENSGGGGGAGAVGSSATSGGAGNGGNGVAVAISGSSVTYAGGGGGGAYYGGTQGSGGTGGGGAGAILTTTNSVAGTANTGGGGGGGQGSDGTTKSGGSGIVIVRYPV